MVNMGIWTFLNPLNWFRRKRNGLRLKTRAELYKGDIHPVVDVEGIGPSYERQLAEVGIVNTDQLLAHPAAAVADAIDTQEKRVRTWQAMAELAVVNGIGPQYAEALARGGVEGIADLVSRDVLDVVEQVNERLDALGTKVTGGKVSETRVRKWQEAARGMKRRKVTVHLFGEALPPVSKQARRDAAANGRARNGHAGTQTRMAATAETEPERSQSTGMAGARGKTASTSTPAASTAARKPAAPATSVKSARTATCAALTAAGTPCKRAARAGSKHCASHKGYRAPATRGATKMAAKPAPKSTSRSTGSAAVKTASTAKTSNPATKTSTERDGSTRRVHVTHNGYKLYQKGNRFYFSKKPQTEVKQDGAEPVYEVPRNREIKVTQNGLPVLKSK